MLKRLSGTCQHSYVTHFPTEPSITVCTTLDFEPTTEILPDQDLWRFKFLEILNNPPTIILYQLNFIQEFIDIWSCLTVETPKAREQHTHEIYHTGNKRPMGLVALLAQHLFVPLYHKTSINILCDLQIKVKVIGYLAE